ncbi:hypothetical protein D3C78_1891150 [compost metagenome]
MIGHQEGVHRQSLHCELTDDALGEYFLRQLLDHVGLAPDVTAGAELNEVVREQA